MNVINKEIKLIGIDVDNTLVNAKKEITPEVKDTISAARSQGIKVVICTGRALSGVTKYLKELEINNRNDEYIVGFNGAVVQCTNGKLLSEKHLSYQDYLVLEEISRKEQLHFQAVDAERIYTANRDIGHYSVYNSRIVNMEISYRTKEEMANIPIYKCMFLDKSKLLDKFESDPLFAKANLVSDITRTEPIYLEGVAKNTDKGTGLAILCKHLNIRPENVMTIGDESNDISMIKYAGIGVAMGNAVTDVKKVSNMITNDCEHNGVAKAIQAIL
ncbi:Cof-type HAD-IIB family hydrolase [Lactobacillus sp. ESL0731]|uniref:Cof-type HAD-IIB family hydrolase n=1 Tax=unclassified Lactobacillus TaxID=2620435 RepID=UPI0023F65EC4|nr:MULTISPECIES: Cof-type HAD-IIB family hydrolase [unclassified Lactobacillus]WEV51616.1 Cof-type HAD-IIB family hydrolase [Lactobacillus sp. ESL0700]WEV62745.1 Cof-type HAD-IIB family hydrolase [Lactobacillus sp. ESL0731]